MFDIKWVRENPDAFDRGLGRRGLEPQAQNIIAKDELRRSIQTELQELQQRRNETSKAIGQLVQSGEKEQAEAAKAEVSAIKDKMAELEEAERRAVADLDEALGGLPNYLRADVPDGADEDSNVELRSFGTPPDLPFPPKEHYELGEALGGMDFEKAAKLAGSRFAVVSGPIARLHRALSQFMLNTHVLEHGYREVMPPLLVRDEVLYGTGQLPKFAEDQFRTTDGRWLIPTAEVPLTNLVAGEILDEAELPLRVTAWTPCFRSEAGSAGRDTRGMLRQHQFEKVELVSVVHPDKSDEELERMTACAEEVLKRLELPYRVMVLCAGDTGFGARRTHDIEVWLPGQKAYREISSCSTCGDFQARRMKARFRSEGEKGTRFLHTLNGSGVAVGRALIAVMENYQQEDGSIKVPEALKPYMGGLEVITKEG